MDFAVSPAYVANLPSSYNKSIREEAPVAPVRKCFCTHENRAFVLSLVLDPRKGSLEFLRLHEIGVSPKRPYFPPCVGRVWAGLSISPELLNPLVLNAALFEGRGK